MFCLKCKIETEDKYCENCGGATVEDQETNLQFNQANNTNSKIKTKVVDSKTNIKKTIKLVIILVVLVGGFTGYKVLQSKYT
ncbi:MAG TPA: hypothetical protein VIM70_07840, partial [Clostridium sp.]|uniref:hypothetical protein n=1 Tax=Clostridium sp. TaxID=1506 RepID=UPI002F94CE78